MSAQDGKMSQIPRSLPPAVQAQIRFIITHLSIVLTLAIVGNLALVFVIFRGNKVMKRQLSPVQVRARNTVTPQINFEDLQKKFFLTKRRLGALKFKLRNHATNALII